MSWAEWFWFLIASEAAPYVPLAAGVVILFIFRRK